MTVSHSLKGGMQLELIIVQPRPLSSMGVVVRLAGLRTKQLLRYNLCSGKITNRQVNKDRVVELDLPKRKVKMFRQALAQGLLEHKH